MRGEDAFADEAFVAAFCAERGIPLHAARVDVRAQAKERRIGEEQAGREARYALFEQAAAVAHFADAVACAGQEPPAAPVVATAHTASDQAETLLLNLLRGSGLEGLAGIPPARPGFVRPLLEVTRAEVEDYCRRHGLDYVTDSTNLEDRYRRNRIRHHLLPQLEAEYNPNLTRTLCRTASLLREEAALLDALVDDLPAARSFAGLLLLPTAPLKAVAPALARRHLRRELQRQLGVTLSLPQAERLAELALGGAGRCQPGGGLMAHHSCGVLAVMRRDWQPPSYHLSVDREGLYPLFFFGALRVSRQTGKEIGKNSGKGATIHRLSCGIILDALSLRPPRQGERCRLVRRREAPLAHLMAEAGIPAFLRPLMPVVECGGEIVALAPLGPAEEATAADGEDALVLEWLPDAAIAPFLGLPDGAADGGTK